MADNTSQSGGFLLPVPSAVPLEGQALRRFLQQWVVGISGLDGTMVRPVAQGEPPNIPNAGECWAAISILNRPADTFPAVIHKVDAESPEGFDELQRNEALRLLVSFYDLGSNGQADMYASMFRDGTSIPQNLEYLRRSGFALNSVGDLVDAPILFKSRWKYGLDLPVIVVRQINRQYRVKNVVSADGEIVTSAGLVLNIDVTDPDADP